MPLVDCCHNVKVYFPFLPVRGKKIEIVKGQPDIIHVAVCGMIMTVKDCFNLSRTQLISLVYELHIMNPFSSLKPAMKWTIQRFYSFDNRCTLYVTIVSKRHCMSCTPSSKCTVTTTNT